MSYTGGNAGYVRRLGGVLGGAPPSLLAGYTVWFNPADLSTLFQDEAGTTPVTANGQSAQYWANKGSVACALAGYVGGGYPAPVYSAAGLNGKQSLYCGPAGNGALSTARGITVGAPVFSNAAGLTLAGAGSVFIVWKPEPGNALFTIGDDAGYGKLMYGFSHPGAFALNIWSGGADVELVAAPGANGCVVCFGWGGTNKYVGVDDLSDAALISAVGGTWQGSGNNLGLGGTNPSIAIYGWLGDVVIYPSWLSEGDRVSVGAYLTARYGL